MPSQLYTQPPLVNRRPECALLDEMVEGVCTDRRMAVAWLYGEAGCGKSALAGHVLDQIEVPHHRFYGAFDARSRGARAIGQMLAQHFGCSFGSWEEVYRHIDDIYEKLGFDRFEARHDVLGLTDIITASAGNETERARCGFESPRLRNLALARLFRKLAESKPVVLWLDDADTDLGVLSLLRHLLADEGEAFPVLAMVTAREEVARHKNASRRSRLLQQILDDARTTRIKITALSDDDQLELIERFAPLAPELAHRVVGHTRGNPLFAIQLITTWYERDLLVPCGGRLILRESDQSSFPSTVDQVWSTRLDRALRDWDERRIEDGMRALQVAAALGPHVDNAEWREVCKRGQLALSDDLLDELIDHGLAVRTEPGWRFAHGLLHHAIVEMARSAGRWEALNVWCAQVLEERDETRHARRIADHLLEAGRAESALEPLYVAGRLAGDRGSYEEAEECFETHSELLEDLGVPPDDKRCVQNMVGRAFIAMQTGDPQRADRLGDEALRRAEEHGWLEEAGWAALLLGRRESSKGRRPESKERFRQARAYFDQIDNVRGLANAQASLAYAYFSTGQMEPARRNFDEALHLFEEVDATAMQARLVQIMVHLDIDEGGWDEAEQTNREAMRLSRKCGDQVVEAGCWANRGEIACERGEWTEARTSYRNAIRLYRLARNRNEYNARLNLVRLDIAQGKIEEAEQKLDALLEKLPSVGLQTYLGTVFMALACCAAKRDVLQRAEEYISRASKRFETLEQAFIDEASLAELTAETLFDAGHVDTGLRALELAIGRYRALNHDEKVARLERRLEQLASSGPAAE